MLLVYASRTNNIDRFVQSLDLKNTVKITEKFMPKIMEPFWLLTYTDVLGKVPVFVEKFLEYNNEWLKAVGASGNMNFGNNFAHAADVISEKYQVPIVIKFELSGSIKDRTEFRKKLLDVGGF